jgi:hypothetical protein
MERGEGEEDTRERIAIEKKIILIEIEREKEKIERDKRIIEKEIKIIEIKNIIKIKIKYN